MNDVGTFYVFGLRWRVRVNSSLAGEMFRAALGPQCPHAVSDGWDVELDIHDTTKGVELPDNLREGAKEWSRNPSTHFTTVNEVVVSSNGYWVKRTIRPAGQIAITVSGPVALEMGIMHRHKSREFPSALEAFEQFLWEIIIIPTVWSLDDRALIHAASFVISGNAFLVSGTGGVGKTSTLLAASAFPESSFLADDISVVDSDGTVYANGAWPKIYAYNLINSPRSDLEQLTFRDRSLWDQFWFKIQKAYRGPSWARRKIKPTKLFSQEGFQNLDAARVTATIFLSVGTSPQPCLRQISPAQAATMATSVVAAEYAQVSTTVLYEEFNAAVEQRDPFWSSDQISRQQSSVLESFFQKHSVYLLRIPETYNSVQTSERVMDFVQDQLNRS